MIWLLYALAALGTWLAWNVIHEMSHVLMAKALVGLKKWKIYPYPHKSDGNFYWARTSWQSVDKPTRFQKAAIHLAPRIPNIIFIVLMALACMASSALAIFWLIFCSGALVDLLVGSLGIGKYTDLKIAARQLWISPWWLRVAGLVAFSQGAFILFMLIFGMHS